MGNYQYSEVLLTSVKPDEEQPRKDFDPERLGSLIKSIEKHGIRQPLVVQKEADGTYLLVDGERRYRAATELNLKTVPVIVQAKTSDSDRVIQQFHLQEQHQSWTGVEKAMAVGRLSQELGLDYTQVGELLGITKGSVRDYKALWELRARDEYLKSDIGLKYATGLKWATNELIDVYRKENKETPSIEYIKMFQQKVINDIIEGNIKNTGDVSKLRDVFKADPQKMYEYVTSAKGANTIYDESNVHHATVARQASNQVTMLDQRINPVLTNDEAIKIMRETKVIKANVRRVRKKLEFLESKLEE